MNYGLLDVSIPNRDLEILQAFFKGILQLASLGRKASTPEKSVGSFNP
jgi:hypothetical protein